MKQGILIFLYLSAIIIANLTTAFFGPNWSIINAFVLIGLDLTTRDYLHEAWQKGRWWKLSLLIAAGSIISWLLNKDAGQIAIASFVAFASAGIIDTVAYHLLKSKAHILKVNGSNVLSSAVDSLIFPWIAFGGIMPLITIGQFVAKAAGGFIWYWILRRFNVVVAAGKE
jgi:uncharacterized PurR-regulated membrane protein YhhQ (DUF165 family)